LYQGRVDQVLVKRDTVEPGMKGAETMANVVKILKAELPGSAKGGYERPQGLESRPRWLRKVVADSEEESGLA